MLLITPSAGLLLPSVLISDDVTLRAIKRKKKTWNIIKRRDLLDAWKIETPCKLKEDRSIRRNGSLKINMQRGNMSEKPGILDPRHTTGLVCSMRITYLKSSH